jgi:hypothetical protein
MTITLEGDAAERLAAAAERAGFGSDDVDGYVRAHFKSADAAMNADAGDDGAADDDEEDDLVARLRKVKTTGVTYEQIAEWNRSEI